MNDTKLITIRVKNPKDCVYRAHVYCGHPNRLVKTPKDSICDASIPDECPLPNLQTIDFDEFYYQIGQLALGYDGIKQGSDEWKSKLRSIYDKITMAEKPEGEKTGK